MIKHKIKKGLIGQSEKSRCKYIMPTWFTGKLSFLFVIIICILYKIKKKIYISVFYLKRCNKTSIELHQIGQSISIFFKKKPVVHE